MCGIPFVISKKGSKCVTGNSLPKENRIENNIIYPPTFVIFSKAFIILLSKISKEKQGFEFFASTERIVSLFI